MFICGWVVIFHYSLYSNLSSNIQKFIKSLKKLVKTCKNRIMKVEAVVLRPMQAGNGKQGIKFAWPKIIQSGSWWMARSQSVMAIFPQPCVDNIYLFFILI